MVFGTFFGGGEKKRMFSNGDGKKVEQSDDEKTRLSRRQFLVGAGALAAATMLPHDEAKAYAGESEEALAATFEEREKNADVIDAYSHWIKENQAYLADPDLPNYTKLKIISHHLPQLERSMLDGTRFDHDKKPPAVSTFRKVFTDGSWPSVRVKELVQNGKRVLDYAHEGVLDDAPHRYANAFFVNGILISNTHVIKDSFNCTFTDPLTTDIAACTIGSLTSQEKDLQNIKEEDTRRVMLSWDTEKIHEDLHGKVVHIPNIHQLRGSEASDKTDITSGVLIKISSDMPKNGESSNGIIEAIGKDHSGTKDFTEVLKKSYFCVIAARDTNGDNRINASDFSGVSGSPVFTQEDCEAGRNIPSGIVWGVSQITVMDEETGMGKNLTIALIHGPDVLGEMINTLDPVTETKETIESGERIAVTIKIQEALNAWRRKKQKEAIVADGEYGEKTYKAVYFFQVSVFGKNSEFTPGIVDERTWKALLPKEPFVDIKALYANQGE